METAEVFLANAPAKASLKKTAVIGPLGPVMGILHLSSQAFRALILNL
jgi:hypothetical protein